MLQLIVGQTIHNPLYILQQNNYNYNSSIVHTAFIYCYIQGIINLRSILNDHGYGYNYDTIISKLQSGILELRYLTNPSLQFVLNSTHSFCTYTSNIFRELLAIFLAVVVTSHRMNPIGKRRVLSNREISRVVQQACLCVFGEGVWQF